MTREIEFGNAPIINLFLVPIMASAMSCGSCSKQVLASPEGRMPPWCPHCGASLKNHAAPKATPAAAAPIPLGHAGFMPTVDAAPTESFFHACVPGISENNHRLYRVYITASDLLVFAIGTGAVSMGEVLARTRPSQLPRGGIAGAMAMRSEAKELDLAKRVAELDAADENNLRQYAASGDAAFQVIPQDIKWMTL